MKLCMDFRKYDGVVGGAQQFILQIVRHAASKGHSMILLVKQNRLQEVEAIFKDEENIQCLPLPVTTHAISLKNMHLDSATIQEIAERIHRPEGTIKRRLHHARTHLREVLDAPDSREPRGG